MVLPVIHREKKIVRLSNSFAHIMEVSGDCLISLVNVNILLSTFYGYWLSRYLLLYT